MTITHAPGCTDPERCEYFTVMQPSGLGARVERCLSCGGQWTFRLWHTSSMELILRPAVAADAAFLTEMVVAAAFWRPDGPRGSIDHVLGSPELAHYVTRWPRPGDLGLVAEGDGPVGAAWLRFFTANDPGYGFVDIDVPEVSMGIVKQWRGKGIGSRLLDGLIDAARDARLPALSLSVEPDNFARGLYERFGFQQVGQAGGSLTMLLRL